MSNTGPEKGKPLPSHAKRSALIFRNTFSLASSAMIAQVLALATMPLLLNKVSAAEFGIYTMGAAFVGYFSLLSLVMILVQGPVMTWLSPRITENPLVAFGSLMMCASFVLLRYEDQALLYAAAVLFGLGNGLRLVQGLLDDLEGTCARVRRQARRARAL